MRTLIITGGTGGLGVSVVARLAQEYRCVVLARHASSDDESILRADLNDEASVRDAIAEAVRRFGAPYGLVHMAGGFAMGKVSETKSALWEQQMALNVSGAFIAIREMLAVMSRNDAGRIVAISSAATLEKGAAAAAYTVSKSALNALIVVTAAELDGSRITANALLPGTLDTEASRESMPDAKRVPLARVAETIAFLLSDGAANINGALIPLRPEVIDGNA